MSEVNLLTLFENLDLGKLEEFQKSLNGLIKSIKQYSPGALRLWSCNRLKTTLQDEVQKGTSDYLKIQKEIDYRKERGLSMDTDIIGSGVRELWKTNGQECRKDGPQTIYRYDNGMPKYEGWKVEPTGHFNRPKNQGPTTISYHKNGKREGISYFENDIHSDGLSFIEYDEQERIIEERYFEAGFKVKTIRYHYK